MLTRRNFLRFVATSIVGAVATACARALPTPTADPLPTRALPAVTLAPTATRTPTAEPAPTATATPGTPEFIKVRGDQFSLRGERFPVNGFNYYPRLHPWRTFNLGEWDPLVTERELQLGVDLGANVVRTFIDYNFSIDLKTPPPTPIYLPPAQQYIQNVREFLDIAGRLKLQVIVTLFDGMDWAIYQSQNQWIAEEYLKEFIPSFANDPRIFCWDLQNEPDKAIRTVGEQPVISFFKRISQQIRALDPNHLQTIGWIDRARAEYFPDLDDDLDFWCFHFYDDASQLGDLIRFYKSKTTKPVLLEEFGLATGGPGPDGQHTEIDQWTYYSLVFAFLQGYNMCGSLFWILTDFPKGLAGNPPLPDDSPENHYGIFRLDYSEKLVAAEIRYAWKGS